uniref:ARAD1D06842p n=1 Tax=Blastobotrys adeninivorans TaxID=409370 RepID=A0A060T8H8_BLAAD
MLESVTVRILALILAFPVLLWAYSWYDELKYRRRAKKVGCELPAYKASWPAGLPLVVSTVKAMRRNELLQHTSRFTDGVPASTVRMQALGRVILVTNAPENIKAILATQFKEFDLSRRHSAFLTLLGDGIFTLSGNGWYHSRAMLRPQFSNEQVSRLHDIERCMQAFINLAKVQSAGGRYFDIQENFFKLTIDTATEFLFGESTDCLSAALEEAKNPGTQVQNKAVEFAECFNYGQYILSLKFGVANSFHPLVGGKKYNYSRKVCHDFVDGYVRMALDQADQEKPEKDDEEHKSYVFLKELTRETRDPIVMRDQALNILLAGRDTTASLLSFAFAVLVRRPDILAKLREAVAESFGDTTEGITFHTLKRCDYLKYFINETLRLYPTVPRNSRECNKDTTLPVGGGPDGTKPIFVPKGSTVAYVVYNLHRNPDIWGPDAHVFRPERWAETNKLGGNWTFIPFNGGPRICLGQQFALTEAGYTIVRLIQSFKTIQGPPGIENVPIKEYAALTSSVAGGVEVTVS